MFSHPSNLPPPRPSHDKQLLLVAIRSATQRRADFPRHTQVKTADLALHGATSWTSIFWRRLWVGICAGKERAEEITEAVIAGSGFEH